jgi:hypothetical protein
LPGLGLRLHFNSTQVQFDGLSNMLQTSLFLAPSVLDDTEDFDADPTTDMFVSLAWADIGGAWALTDGVLIVRYLFGVTGTQLTDGFLGTGALRTNPVEIIAFLDGFLPAAASASLVVSTQDTLIANYDEPTVSVGIPGNFETGPPTSPRAPSTTRARRT